MDMIRLLPLFVLVSTIAIAAPPYVVSPDGTYLGTLSSDPFAQDSISNPYGKYGSPFSQESINNPFGPYGSRFSDKSPNNPYATSAPMVYGH